tara:strand:+ start:453 stop:599 length:147 start_codon:yes stop_codon:yes gene_type:complete
MNLAVIVKLFMWKQLPVMNKLMDWLFTHGLNKLAILADYFGDHNPGAI